MEPIRINDRISYYPAINVPLAADVGMVEGDQNIWLFDLGPNADVVKVLQTHYNQGKVKRI